MKKLDQSIQDLKAFTESIAESSNTETPPSKIAIMFQSQDDGGLSFGEIEAAKYHSLLDALQGSLPKTTNISRKALERLVQRAILAALDMNNRREETSLSKRIYYEFAALRKTLLSSPKNWFVYSRVYGVTTKGMTVTIGKVTFTDFTATQEDQIREVAKKSRNEAFLAYVEEDIVRIKSPSDSDAESVVAIIEVSAIDDTAARISAIDYLRRVVDIINFYGGLLYPKNMAKVTLPNEASRTHSIYLLTTAEEPRLYTSHHSRIGSITPFDLTQLESARGFERVNRILATSNPSKIEQRLLSSLQWAGRATVDIRREEAFLLFAIALESLVLPREKDADISYRLRIFVPHLLGYDAEGRKKIKKHIASLYGKRSQIVHQGDYYVSDSELELLQGYCRGCILSLLVGKPFQNMQRDEDLMDWFDNEVLK